MNEYLFVLGRASALCQAELKAVLEREKISYSRVFSSPEVFHVSTPDHLDADYLIQTLGGTIKIAEVIEKLENKVVTSHAEFIRRKASLISASISRQILKYIRQAQYKQVQDDEIKRITLGLSGYNGFCYDDLNHHNRLIKEKLEKQGIRARFVLPSNGVTLSSVVVQKQKLKEFLLVKEDGKLILAKTLVVQDFEDWGKRDFGRPAPDPHQGMLPPKVARMMINIGTWNMEHGTWNKFMILDPFCGVGTILAEGMMLGLNVIGGDQSEEAVEKTKKNLEWLIKNYGLRTKNLELFITDATHISEKIPADSVDTIVTESYLGPLWLVERHSGERSDSRIGKGSWTSQDDGKIKNIILGLEKLFIGCFKDWYKILKPGGRIVIALPSFKVGKQEFFVKKPLDTCENLGYTLVTGPYQYSRPQAVVIRNIYVFKKN